MREGIVARKGYISIDGVEYIPRRQLDELRAERDRLAAELERLREELERLEKESRDES
jgi:cell division protein FtsB